MDVSALLFGASAFHLEKTKVQKDTCLFTGSVLKTNGANLNPSRSLLYLLSPGRADRGQTNIANPEASEYEIYSVVLL